MTDQRTKRLDDAIVRLRKVIEGHSVGSRLPTERQLGEELHIGRSTVREAISQLVALGLVDVVHGRGMFVADRQPVELRHPLQGPADAESLLAGSARVAIEQGVEESGFIAMARTAYRSEAALRTGAAVTIVSPLPTAALSEVREVLGAAGLESVECALAELEDDSGGVVIVPWHKTANLESDHSIVPVGAGLSADLIIAVSALPQGERVYVDAGDSQTTDVVCEVIRSTRPDLELEAGSGSAGDGAASGTLLVEDRADAALEPGAIRFRTTLSPAERNAIKRALAQPAESESATEGNASSARSKMGTASSHTAD